MSKKGTGQKICLCWDFYTGCITVTGQYASSFLTEKFGKKPEIHQSNIARTEGRIQLWRHDRSIRHYLYRCKSEIATRHLSFDHGKPGTILWTDRRIRKKWSAYFSGILSYHTSLRHIHELSRHKALASELSRPRMKLPE